MGISVWQLAIIAIIVALLFGTKRLSTIGSDVGTTIKGFKSAMSDDVTNNKLSQEPTTKAESKEA
ncbi:preprotein translocase subunit TatA [Vibrio breoganii]|nr:preprotein translocase subunit TatA [Vibrio breoganii]PMG96740.1 preprotein translocase subunit TatA [Vibrio breoganii]PML90369.1 preprotein translocase subunit TatA [Vibrio breoganii]